MRRPPSRRKDFRDQEGKTFRIVPKRSPSLKGFCRKLSILVANDAAAISSVFALVTITDMPGLRRLASRYTSRLDAPGRVTSRSNTSMWFFSARIKSKALDPSLASMTDKPFFRSILETACRNRHSSSTNKMVASRGCKPFRSGAPKGAIGCLRAIILRRQKYSKRSTRAWCARKPDVPPLETEPKTWPSFSRGEPPMLSATA
jgi:hypothetical protein